MKKKILVTLCLLLILLLLASCGEALTEVEAERPLTSAELLEIGENHLLELNYEEALMQFTSVIEIESTNPNGYTGAFAAYIGLERVNDAIAVLRQGLTALPYEPAISETLIDTYMDLSMYSDAETLITQLLDRSPNQLGLQTRLDEVQRLTHTHTWSDATCYEPMTCIECGDTEGSVLAHEWRDANYQEPQTCNECNEPEGNPLTPSFVELGYEINMFLGEVYQYRTMTYDRSAETIGIAMVESFVILSSDDTHDAREGYEWQIARVRYEFSDNNAQRSGFMAFQEMTNFYELDASETSEQVDWDDTGVLRIEGVVNYYGTDYEYICISNILQSGWVGDIGVIVLEFALQVPIGYDGFVLASFNYMNAGDDKLITELFDDDTLFLRFMG